jgi:hypothetical protein
MDWTGFDEDDVLPITFMLASLSQEKLNPSDFAIVSERAAQGMVEQMLGTRVVQQVLVDDDAFKFEHTVEEEGGPAVVHSPLIDPEKVYYYGISQGAVMGGALVAMSPDLNRGVFGVGGGPYSLLLPRSHDFDQFFLLLKNKYDDHRDTMLFVIGLTQQLWDPTESGGWMWDMTRDAETPNEILEQVAIYDNQVTTLGAAYQARAWGSKIPSNAVRPIWDVDTVELGEGQPGPILVEWKYDDLPDEPFDAYPPATEGKIPAPYDDGRALDPHECPRREAKGQEQIWHFFQTGLVIDTCGPDGCHDNLADVCP